MTPKVRELVVAAQAAAMARKDGEARLAALKAAPGHRAGRAPRSMVSRAQARDLPREIVDAVLKAPTASLPGAIGVDLGDAGLCGACA